MTPFLDNIERISAPSGEIFRRDYLLAQRPVIITDLFQGQPISRLNTWEAACAQLGDLLLELKPEYFSWLIRHFRANEAGAPAQLYRKWRTYGARKQRVRLRKYLDFVAQPPRNNLVCSEFPTPPAVSNLFEWPGYCFTDPDTDADNTSYLFVANTGNLAHLHCDGDYQHVLHHNVCGAKRLVLIPQRSSRKLNPVGHFSSLMLENFTDSELAAFLRYTEAYECVLGPGETLFIPALTWHYVAYLKPSLSFNLRFGRNKYLRFLSNRITGDFYAQAIAAQAVDEEKFERGHAAAFAEIVAAYHRKHRTAEARYRHIQRAVQSVYARVVPWARPQPLAFTEVPGLFDTYAQYRLESYYLPPLKPD